MSTSLALGSTANRRIGRSVVAIATAFVANAVLSVTVDQVLHVLHVYPEWGQPMFDPALNALALGYRIVFGVVAGVIVAHLAPSAPMRHAVILGIIGLVVATLAAVYTITQYDFGPDWYPIALALSSFPTIWLGAALHGRRRRA